MNNAEQIKKESWAKEVFFVAIKILLRDGNKLLLIHDVYGDWDLPGGRIRKDQFETPLEQVLREKVVVEIGSDVKFKLGEIKTTLRVEREESGREGKIVRIFGVGYEARYLGGKIILGDYHDKYEWVDLKTVNLDDYSTRTGWADKLKDYQNTLL